jgi:hypothetical protein
MKTHRLPPLIALLPVCLSLSLGTAVAPAHAADAAARTLDWGQAGRTGVASPPSLPAFSTTTPEHAVGKKVAFPAAPKVAAKGLFALEDRAIIIVGGKTTTAGTLKQALQAELAAKAGPPKIVNGGARKLDLAALVSPGGSGGPKPFPSGGIGPLLPKSGAKTAQTSGVLQGAQVIHAGATPVITGSKVAVGLGSLRCADKGLPKISESPGKLKAGGSATLWGQCFGDRPGRVEVIGQFPGGKLNLAFTAWDDNAIELAVPATVRGAADHVVSVTVVAADGRSSPAMQAQFVAQRERVEVPARLWSPDAAFELSATAETSHLVDPDDANEAHAGHTTRTLRVQPQCSLDTMDAIVHAGAVTGIHGWEQGPANEASVSIDWVGVCTNARATTDYNYLIVEGTREITIKSACRVAFETRAWAYCPAGIAP